MKYSGFSLLWIQYTDIYFVIVHLLSLERVPELDAGYLRGCLHCLGPLTLTHASLPPGHLGHHVLTSPKSGQSLTNLVSEKLPVDAGLLWRPPGQFYRI